MNSDFFCWLCYVKLLVCDPDKNSCRGNLVYCSLPAKHYSDLVGFQNKNLKIIAVFKFHPMSRCAITEIDDHEQIKVSINVLMVEGDLLDIRLWANWFKKRQNLIAYYGFDVETVMQIAANKQVDIIIVNTIYWGKYREVDWIKNIQMLKSNPETAQIPVILKLTGQVMVGDRERYLLESGADDAIRVNPGSYNSIVEKIKHTLSADDSTLNTRIN